MKKYSISSSERIKSQKQIEKVFSRSAISLFSPSFSLRFYIENAELSESLAGFSVSKRLYKRAVDRNKIKRWMREAYRQNKDMTLNLSSSQPKKQILFFILQKKLAKWNYETVLEDMMSLLSQFQKKSQKNA